MTMTEYPDGDSFEAVWFPFDRHVSLGTHRDASGRRVWRFDVAGLLFDDFDGLFRRSGWSRGVWPSYGEGFAALWNNVLTWLTPWYRMRRRLMANLFNRNDSKLLFCDRKRCHFRSRSSDVYFDVRLGFAFGKMYVVRYVTTSGDARNLFLHTMCREDSGKECEPLVEERKTAIRRMPVLTRRQCERFLDAAVEATKDSLRWW